MPVVNVAGELTIPVGIVDPMMEPPDRVNTTPLVPVLSEMAEPRPAVPEDTTPLVPVVTMGMPVDMTEDEVVVMITLTVGTVVPVTTPFANVKIVPLAAVTTVVPDGSEPDEKPETTPATVVGPAYPMTLPLDSVYTVPSLAVKTLRPVGVDVAVAGTEASVEDPTIVLLENV